MTKRLLVITFVFALVMAFVSVTPARAQSVLEGKITGTVTDDKGEPLPGVTVELTGPSIMGKRATITSARGTFVFLNVPPGMLTLTATMPSFKKYVQPDINLGAGKVLEVNPVLQLGPIEETVTVIAASPIVDVKTSTVDSRLEKEMLAKLPTSRDAFYDLSLTTPGMFDVGTSSGWLPSPTAYGGSSMENVFLVNGVNTTNPRGAAWGSLVKVNYNAVEEVRVVALGSKAEYGSFSGAAIDVLTRSGSNAFHGNAAYYTELRGGFFKPNYPIRDVGQPDTPVNSWLFYRSGDTLAATTKKNWEGNFTLGGPIIKDKIWFYGAFDYIRSDSLPVNWSLLNSYWGRYADLKISAEPFRNNRAWVSYHYESNKGTGWSWGTEPEWDTSMTYGVGTKNNTLSAQWQWLPSSTAIFTAKYLGFWTDDQPVVPSDAPNHPGYINWWKWGSQYGVNGAFPYIEAQKSTRQTVQADMSYYAEDFLGEHDVKFGVQYTKGRGNWVGGYFQNYVNFAYPLGGWWGFYPGLGYAISALQTQTWYYGNAFQNGLLFYNHRDQLNPFMTVRTADSLGFFLDDQWSPTKRLTFNIGLRYDRMTTKYGAGKVYDLLTQPSDINGPPPVLRTRQATGNIFDFKTFAPRLGVTYQLTRDAKTVLRANYGRYYMPLAVEFLRRFGPDMPTVNRTYQIFMVPWGIADIDGNGYIDNQGFNGGPNELREAVRQLYGSTPIFERPDTIDQSWTLNVAPNVKDMYTDQFTFNVEREIIKEFSLSATYIYKRSRNLFVNVPINRLTGLQWQYERVAFDPTNGDPVDLYSIAFQDYNADGVADGLDVAYVGNNTTFRVENMQAYNYTNGGAMFKPQRTYQALQLVLNKRYSNRWQGLASAVYSWSDGTAQRTMRQDDNMMGPMITDDTWMGSLNYTINNMTGALPFVPKWEIKASGSYTIPKIEFDLGLRFRMHTGRPLWQLEGYPVHSQYGFPAGSVISGGLNQVVATTAPTWLPSLAIFDVRAEKAIKIARYGSIHFILDIFNLFNAANVTNADYYGNWGLITGISDARRFRLSFMYQF
jgi:outer membrane receptor protein involved in Fe transport